MYAIKFNYIYFFIIAKSLEFLVQDLLERAAKMSIDSGTSKLQSSNM